MPQKGAKAIPNQAKPKTTSGIFFRRSCRAINSARIPINAAANARAELLVGTSVDRSTLIRSGRTTQPTYFQNVTPDSTKTETPEETLEATPEEICAPAKYLSPR